MSKMRRRAEAPQSNNERVNEERKNPVPRTPSRGGANGRLNYRSILINFGKCLLLIVIIPPFLNYASLQREVQMLFPKGGQMVDVGLGQKMHMLCKGHGKPVVILDSPAGMSSDVWIYVQENVAKITKVCSYDRMGLGFSKRLMENESTGTEKVWGMSTTGRMVDDLHRLLEAALIAKPFILVGSEIGALNSRFYSHIHDVQVSDLVLIDPIPEDVFEEKQWKEYWYMKLLPSLQARQFSAATGLSRLLIMLGAIEPTLKGENVSEDVIQRQYYSCCQGDKDTIVLEFSKDGKKGLEDRVPKKYLLSNPAHQSCAVDEHFFLNESAAQVRDITKFKPLSSKTTVTVITGDRFDHEISDQLNQMVAALQKKFLEASYPSANHIHIKGADRQMIHKQPSAVIQHLRRLVNQRQAKQQRQ